jgi:hypothetical protein
MSAERSPLRFKGAPTRLLATLAAQEGFAVAPGGSARAGHVVFSDKSPLPLNIRPMQTTNPPLSLLSFRLPKSTRPGHYEGSAEVGGKRIPIVVDVEARPRLRFLPPKVSFRGAPGARLRAEVTVLNLGNVDATVEPESTFCIFDSRGIDQALYEALTAKETDGKRRIDRVMDELAESHGGLVRAVVLEGAGVLPPEAARELVMEFQFSHRMRARQTYRGAWSVSETSLEVEMKATEAVGGGTE